MISSNKLVLILISCSIIVVSITIFKASVQEKDVIEMMKVDYLSFNKEKIDLYKLTSHKKEKSVLIIVHDELCSTCINEIIEYNSILTEWIDSNKDVEFKTIIVGVSDNVEENFLRMTGAISPVEYFQLDNEVINKIRIIEKDNVLKNQILFYNSKAKQIEARIKVLNFRTEPFFKNNLVQEAFFELNNPK